MRFSRLEEAQPQLPHTSKAQCGEKGENNETQL